MGKASVLVVDDERKIRDVVRTYLEHDGYAVFLAGSGQEALEVAARLGPDLVVLDLMLPDLPGEEVARSLRAVSSVPIIMLTAKASEDDRVAGLRLGADDYLPKPFSPRELAARVEAVLRRTPGAEAEVASFDGGELRIDKARREVSVRGRSVTLTRSEFDLLATSGARSAPGLGRACQCRSCGERRERTLVSRRQPPRPPPPTGRQRGERPPAGPQTVFARGRWCSCSIALFVRRV